MLYTYMLRDKCISVYSNIESLSKQFTVASYYQTQWTHLVDKISVSYFLTAKTGTIVLKPFLFSMHLKKKKESILLCAFCT